MLDKARDRKTERIKQIVEHLRARMDKKRAPSVERFVRLFYQRATAADLAENSAENLYGAAFSLWKFAEQRDPGVPKVRVLNPRVDEQGVEVRAYGYRNRQRRHAVPGRFDHRQSQS